MDRVGACCGVAGDGGSILDRQVREDLPELFFSLDLKVK